MPAPHGYAAIRNVRLIDSCRARRHVRPRFARHPVLVQGFPARVYILRLLKYRVQHATAQLGRKKTPQPDLNLHVRFHPPERRRPPCDGPAARVIQRSARGVRAILHPLRRLDRRVPGIRGVREQIRGVIVDGRE